MLSLFVLQTKHKIINKKATTWENRLLNVVHKETWGFQHKWQPRKSCGAVNGPSYIHQKILSPLLLSLSLPPSLSLSQKTVFGGKAKFCVTDDTVCREDDENVSNGVSDQPVKNYTL